VRHRGCPCSAGSCPSGCQCCGCVRGRSIPTPTGMLDVTNNVRARLNRASPCLRHRAASSSSVSCCHSTAARPRHSQRAASRGALAASGRRKRCKSGRRSIGGETTSEEPRTAPAVLPSHLWEARDGPNSAALFDDVVRPLADDDAAKSGRVKLKPPRPALPTVSVRTPGDAGLVRAFVRPLRNRRAVARPPASAPAPQADAERVDPAQQRRAHGRGRENRAQNRDGSVAVLTARREVL
jgi:hypothetical protein